MAKTRIEMNQAEVGRMLRAEGQYSGIRDDLTARMERVLSTAKSDAPVASGEYRDGLHIEQDTTDRAVVRVAGDSDHDWIVEANTGNLARALDQAR